MRETGLTKASGSRSHCDHCGKQLSWFELVPVLSFLWLRGKCSNCGKAIDVRIFLAEVVGLIFFVILGIHFAHLLTNQPLSISSALELIIQVTAAGIILYLAVFDLLTFSIPAWAANGFVIFAVVVNIVVLVGKYLFANQFGALDYGEFGNLVAGLIAGLFVWGLIFFTKQKGIGSGDLYLAVVIGLMLGWPKIVAAFYAMILTASAVGLTYAYFKRKFRGLLVPLVPFIGFGYLVAVVWGEQIFKLLFIQL